jgi:hypothetical protein
VDIICDRDDLPGNNYFFVSTYSFSEICAEFQIKYIETLFPKIIHGFVAWNNIPTYDFGFSFSEEPEIPKTGQV